MLAAIIWGLIQGLTEFLPISSSGHLVIVPEWLARLGVDIGPPDLATSAVLHLGTLAAVLTYFRRDVAKVLRLRSDSDGRRIALLVGVGTIPAVVGLPLEGSLETFQDDVGRVGAALVVTGLVLVLGQRLAHGFRRLEEGNIPDAIVVGIAQALALIPGISRSGMTISAGNGRGLDPAEAARFSFLLGIPAIAGAGALSLPDLLGAGAFGIELIVGLIVAAISGYLAIAGLLVAIRRIGLGPFAAYCLVVGGLTVLVL